MLFSLALPALALAPLAFAANFTVKVGVDATGTAATAYTPNNIVAAVGDFVNFEFVGGNHTVTQSPFSAPCTQLFNTDTNELGIDTGFIVGSATQTPIVPLKINDTTPIWLFCQRKPHCNTGMVMVINAPANSTTKTLAAFTANAATSPEPGYGTVANFSAKAAAANTTASGAISVVPIGGQSAMLLGAVAAVAGFFL